LASCGLVLSVAAALRSELNCQLDVRRWLDLVAIGTIADGAPLDGDNRALVRAGMKSLEQAHRPGVRALKELAELDAATSLSAHDVAFRLAPRINAPGRLRSPELALSLLRAKDSVEAASFAAEIEQLALERRAQQQTIIDQALSEVDDSGWQDAAGLVLGRQGWNHGIVGIVAGRLADRYQRPVVVVGFDGELGRGSVRGPRGSRLHDLLSNVGDVLRRFGGHQAAAGVEVEYPRLQEFRERFVAACVEQQGATDPAHQESAPDAERMQLHEDDDPSDVLDDLMRLEPCGESNPRPKLELQARVLSARAVRGGHLKLELESAGGRRLAGFGIGLGERADSLSGQIRLIGELRPDRWRGGRAVELRVEHIDST
jgi:single-stranded-DNA-specific exonuclease